MTINCRINNWITSDSDALLEDACEACVGEAIYLFEDEYYCVMHYPSQDKITEFRAALNQKTDNKDFNFCCVYFPEKVVFEGNETEFITREWLTFEQANFQCATFSNEVSFYKIKFEKAKFKEATFNKNAYFIIPHHELYPCSFDSVDFSDAIFHGEAYFSAATFDNGARFQNVRFDGKADFQNTKFQGNIDFSKGVFGGETNFNNAIFVGKVNFNSTIFGGQLSFIESFFDEEITFRKAQVKDYVKFKQYGMFGADASLSFDSLRIEKPERLSLHSVNLRPHWFINTDPRKFEFIDVRWDDDLAKERSASKSDRLLSIAYRQLAMNAEENNRYGEAAQFRYNSMDLRRLEKWNGRAFWTLDFWYWALSGYGERVGRATVALLLILFLSCVPYWFTGFASSKDTTQSKKGSPIQVMLAPEQNKAKQILATLVYSLETASLQKPEPRPVTTMARLFVGLETILAPLQAALLALAIRRKYMR